ncbi:hypothetical protein F7725_006250 [Dissostichus mawsoni]|uniref:Uncharacterized protein n=1 Tax=Dissostichus mawsoni TaxID=36200 RepID=A0A7J5YTT7_DISMA|nr:hypothetical protein F7725_006250 [Dissostichus mawsoni]
MLYLRQSQQEILKEEERRYRFLAEKHCGLTVPAVPHQQESVSSQHVTPLSSVFQTGASLQQKADGWKEKVNESKGSRPRTPTHPDHDTQRAAGSGQSSLQSRSRSSSVGESLGLGGGGRAMRALVSHPSSSNPKLLPFCRGETITVLVLEQRNGWLYGRSDNLSHSMNNLLDPPDSYTDQSESTSFGDVPPPATPNRRASSCASPPPERKGEAASETKPPLTPLLLSRPIRGGAPQSTNPFATVKLRPTTTNDRSSPHIH